MHIWQLTYFEVYFSWFAILQIASFTIAVMFFTLMRQAHVWDLDMPIPSLLAAIESNLRVPFPFLALAAVPLLVSLFLSLLMSRPISHFASFSVVSIICYVLANGFIVSLIMVSQPIFYIAATVHVFIKKRSVALSKCSIKC